MRTILTVAVILCYSNILHGKANICQQADTTLTDTLVSFTTAFDKAALPVYTTRADSAEYASLLQRPRFYNNFESGRVGHITYCSTDSSGVLHYTVTSASDPLNPVDTALAPSSRWFYFLITGVNNKTLALTFQESDPRAPVYSYNGTEYQRFNPLTEITGERLPYTFTKKFESDSVYMAYYTPYTNRHLESKLEEWRYKMGVRINSIGESGQGRQMNMLTITNTYLPDKYKKVIYIHGRIHPSETPSSWALEGLIECLTGSSAYARALRDNAVFYILPFINPDGVALGYSRCNANGVNMEINYNQPDSLTQQEVKNVKKFLETITYSRPANLFLNFHSQVAPAMTYWIHNAATSSEKYYKELMTFAHLTTSDNPYFNPEFMSYSNMNPKYIEGMFWNMAGESTIALTHETPYSYYNKEEEGEWVNTENLKWIGQKTLQAIGDYLNIPNPDRIILLPAKARKCTSHTDYGHLYIGEQYFTANKDGAKVVYKTKKLPEGRYVVYRWNTGSSQRSAQALHNCWQEIQTITQPREGRFSLTLPLTPGEKANAILLLRITE